MTLAEELTKYAKALQMIRELTDSLPDNVPERLEAMIEEHANEEDSLIEEGMRSERARPRIY